LVEYMVSAMVGGLGTSIFLATFFMRSTKSIFLRTSNNHSSKAALDESDDSSEESSSELLHTCMVSWCWATVSGITTSDVRCFREGLVCSEVGGDTD